MSNIIKLPEIGKEFKTIKELSEYSTAQFYALQGAVEKIQKLQEEISHLQTLLASTTSLIEDNNVSSIIKSPELAIVEAQINLLTNRAIRQELTLEEVKILDLLVKNKRLLSDESTTIEGKTAKPKKEYSEAQLISLAQKSND